MVPGPAAHVEQALTRAQVGEEVGAGVLGRAPGVAAQHRLMVPVRVGHAYIVACPKCPRCRRCPSASTPSLAGADPAPGRPARVLVAQDVRPVARLALRAHRSCSVGRRAKYLVWEFDDGNRMVLHLSQAGRLDIEEPPEEDEARAAPWPASSSARATPGSTATASASSCASTARSARRRGGCWRRATRARWPGSGPSRAATSSPRSSAPATRGATSRPTSATSTWWRASGAAGATTSCTGPSCRPSPRCAR